MSLKPLRTRLVANVKGAPHCQLGKVRVVYKTALTNNADTMPQSERGRHRGSALPGAPLWGVCAAAAERESVHNFYNQSGATSFGGNRPESLRLSLRHAVITANNKICPGQCGSLGWVSVLQSKRSLVQFRSGHLPGLQVRSLARVREAIDRCFSVTSVFLSCSFSLPSPPLKNTLFSEIVKFISYCMPDPVVPHDTHTNMRDQIR